MFTLSPCPKSFTQDQDKAVLPSETLEQVRSRLASLNRSILAETRRVDTGRLGIPVYLSVCGSDARAIMPTRKQMGKGASPEQAEASALMELMERYGFFSFWENRPGAVLARWSEAAALFKDALMPVEEIIRACHDTITPEQARAVMETRAWAFFPALDIAGDSTVYAPLDLFKQLGEFNGSSAGNTHVESILQGACELVERHVCCVAEETQPELPTIDIAPGAIDDPVLADLVDKFRANGIVVILKDFSLGMPVPTVAAIALDPSTFPHASEIVYTAGTATSPAKAAIRALTEVAQLAGDFHTQACYEASGLPKYQALEDMAWLRKGPVTPLDALPSLERDDMLDELRALATGLKALGFTLYTVNTTNPETKVPTHASFVPGFRFRERDANASLGLFTGRMLTEVDDADTGRAGLAALTRVYPGAHFLPFFQGMLELRQGNVPEALDSFARAEPLQPDAESRSLAAFYQGYAHTFAQDWERAIPPLDRANAYSPDMKEYLNLRGVCLFRLGEYQRAAADFREIITRLDPGSPMDLQNLGLCLKFIGQPQEAAHYLKAALTLDPGLEAAATHLEQLHGQA